MHHQSFLNEMEDILDLPRNSLDGSELLEEFVAWDSLAMLSFAVMASERVGRDIAGRALRKANTVDDLYSVILSEDLASMIVKPGVLQ